MDQPENIETNLRTMYEMFQKKWQERRITVIDYKKKKCPIQSAFSYQKDYYIYETKEKDHFGPKCIFR